MNRYHVEVIGSPKPYKEVLADYVDFSQVGVYIFKVVELNELVDVAFFPTYNSTILKVEYDIENKN